MDSIYHKKALIIDSSAIRPVAFALNNLGWEVKVLHDFATNASLDVFVSGPAIAHGEFSFSYTTQQSIFTSPIVPSQISANRNSVISLSNDGCLSATVSETNQVLLRVADIVGAEQGTLWESSPHWGFLSTDDERLIRLVFEKSRTYDEVALLTNDWHLRQQCLNFEGITIHGTCSMLAGMVLTGFMSYQKGTYSYLGWLQEDRRWIPNGIDEYGAKRKLKFSEVLDIERDRIKSRNNFWLPPS